MKLPVLYPLLSPQDRRKVREEYVLRQNGNCWHCGAPLSGPPHPSSMDKHVTPSLFPPKFFHYPIHLHHDHNTELTLGAVHCHCNAVLWEYYGE